MDAGDATKNLSRTRGSWREAGRFDATSFMVGATLARVNKTTPEPWKLSLVLTTDSVSIAAELGSNFDLI